jgi:hypothetical protein
MKKYSLVGDTNIELIANYFPQVKEDYDLFYRMSLPMMDLVTKSMIETHCAEHEKVFWFCPKWFNGIYFLERLKERSNLQAEEKFIMFRTVEERDGQALVQNAGFEDRIFMVNLYIQLMDYFVAKHENLYLVPWTLCFNDTCHNYLDNKKLWPAFHARYKSCLVVDFEQIALEDIMYVNGALAQSGCLKMLNSINKFVGLPLVEMAALSYNSKT